MLLFKVTIVEGFFNSLSLIFSLSFSLFASEKKKNSLTMGPRLALNSRFSCFSLPSAQSSDTHYHSNISLNIKPSDGYVAHDKWMGCFLETQLGTMSDISHNNIPLDNNIPHDSWDLCMMELSLV